MYVIIHDYQDIGKLQKMKSKKGDHHAKVNIYTCGPKINSLKLSKIFITKYLVSD